METVAVLVTIASVLMNAGVSLSSLYTQLKNQDLKSDIQKLVSNVTSQLKSGRLKVGKLLSLLQNKNTAALQQYLYSNPLISKSFEDINKDADVISGLQAESQNLENLIAQYTNELSSLGYSSSMHGLAGERERYDDVKSKLDKTVKQHKDLEERIANTEISPYGDFTVNTSHLDAVSQNIKGGSNA